MPLADLHTEFIHGARGRLHLTSFLPPSATVRGVVVVAQALAEEANKSRRMLALQGRAFAALGYVLLIPDMYGCGDSEGDFRDAHWDEWVQDFSRVLALGRERFDVVPAVLAMRQGALLAGEALHGSDGRQRLIFWQPCTDGSQALDQLLRVRTVARGLEGVHERVSDLRAALDAGEAIEAAGYELGPELAAGLAGSALKPSERGAGRLAWLRVSRVPRADPSPAAAQAIERWRAAGWDVYGRELKGDAFWATQEIAVAPALLEETTRLLEAWARESAPPGDSGLARAAPA